MTDLKTRSIDLHTGTGTRTSVRLDSATWAAVDLIAERKGIRWGEWVRELLKQNPTAPNATAVIRTAVVDALMTESVTSDDERGFDLESQENHELMRNAAPLNDQQLSEIMETAIIEGQQDHGSFEVVHGHDDSGQSCVWVVNNLKSRLHFALVASIKDSRVLNDQQLSEIMETAIIEGQQDHGSFEVVFGHDGAGRDCVWFTNGAKNGLHLALVAPVGAK